MKKIEELRIGILPYSGVAARNPMLRVSKIKLDRLTILVGPNGAGKTSVLETIGYSVAAALPAAHAALGTFLTSSFRPRFSPPAYIVGIVRLDGREIASLYLDVESINDNLLEKLADMIKSDGSSIDFDTIKPLVSRLQDALRKMRGGVDPSKMFKNIVKEVFGNDEGINASLASIREWRTFKHYLNALDKLLSKKRLAGMHVYLVVAYRRTDRQKSGREETGVGPNRAIVAARRCALTVFMKNRRRGKLPSVLAFHPRLSFTPGVFEKLYESRALEGYLPGEKDAARILSRYIRGVEGFEVIRGRLSLKIGSRRLSVYKLSDGHRMASLLALLYAIAKPPLLLLIDTPEAFLYPDGVRIAAELIARLVAENNAQIVVATQSIEMLQELLVAARENGVLDETVVHKLGIRKDSIETQATWPGRLGLYAMEGLEADLRR